MTFEPDPRRGGSRPVVERRRRGALAPTLAILGVLIALALLFASVWTDVLWYRQLNFLAVYRTELTTKVLLFVLGAAVMAAAVLSSLAIAYQARPIYAPVSSEQASLDRYRESIEPLRRLVLITVPVGLGLFAGSAAAQQWQTALLWWNRVPFNKPDAQFGIDIGFFVFTLPWLQFLSGFATAVVILAGVAALATHYLYGGIRLQGGGQRISSAARMHLALLLAVFLLLRGIDYWLGRYALTTHDSPRITGLTYTDANAVLSARTVLAVIAVLVAVLFVVAAFMEGWRLIPLYGLGLMVVCAVVIGSIYPAIVQRFQVRPNELAKERPYIEKNIRATLDAYALGGVDTIPYPARTQATEGALRNDAQTIPGIRLIDPARVSQTYRQLEQNKQYYAFPDVLDVDRYPVKGKERDTVIAVRELNLDQVPARQRNWVNDHLVYTHGYGVVAAYGNERNSDGTPVFFQSGIPSTGALGDYTPQIYFGERSSEYSIVGGNNGTPIELDYPDDTSPGGQRNTSYTGTGGVPIGSPLNRLLYAMKFREQNLLFSDQINASSKIMYDRSPRDRVEKVAPYLTLDGDPYPVVIGGRVKWVLDGYTTSEHYPYSRLQSLQQATADSVTETSSNVVALGGQQVNYIRNSVKATVDAYDGSVTLYAWDEQDPVLQAWEKAFGNTVKPLSAISGELMSHLRYPEDLFKVQRWLLSTYHVDDAEGFFSGQDYWTVPTDPTLGSGQYQPPFYLTLQMPKQVNPSFSLTSVFIPQASQNGTVREILTGFLAVDSDAGSTPGKPRAGYGTLRLLELPRNGNSTVPAPGQVQNNINAYPPISQQLNLLRQGKSSVENGNLLTLPVGGGLLYVQPVYVQGGGTSSYPLLQKVVAAFGSKIGFADTLNDALDQVFQGNSGAPPIGDNGGSTSTTPTTGQSTTPTGPLQERLSTALADASKALTDSDAALKKGDFTAYGEAQRRLTAAVQRAVDAQNQIKSGAVTTPTKTPATTPSTSSASPTSTP